MNRSNPPDAILREVHERTGDRPFDAHRGRGAARGAGADRRRLQAGRRAEALSACRTASTIDNKETGMSLTYTEVCKLGARPLDASPRPPLPQRRQRPGAPGAPALRHRRRRAASRRVRPAGRRAGAAGPAVRRRPAGVGEEAQEEEGRPREPAAPAAAAALPRRRPAHPRLRLAAQPPARRAARPRHRRRPARPGAGDRPRAPLRRRSTGASTRSTSKAR